MTIKEKLVEPDELGSQLKSLLDMESFRLGLISAIDTNSLITLILNLADGTSEIWHSPLNHELCYPSVSVKIPQAHWFERRLQDMFGITAKGHPRMKSTFAPGEEQFQFPLLARDNQSASSQRNTDFLEVEGDGVYELPVGPVHAGIIEPGHFRLSCMGEEIQNLELRFGYVHRGVEESLTTVDWQKTRFLAEASAGDSPVANALANAIALESILEIEIDKEINAVRTFALEIERLAMHIFDLSGMSYDLGFTAHAATLARLRGTGLRIGELLSGSRFMRGFIRAGGISSNEKFNFKLIKSLVNEFQSELMPVLDTLLRNDSVEERLKGTGIVSRQLAEDFGFVGIVARASGIAYDSRFTFDHGMYPILAPQIALQKEGDAFARTKVRIREIHSSFQIVDKLLETISSYPIASDNLPRNLPANKTGVAIVESFRGELIHLIFTNSSGEIKRYIIKDPSMNNWTGMAIAARKECIADFPICNKSFGLSYSGHDL